MFSTHTIDTRHHQALSSLYAGFLTVDEPSTYSYASSCPPSVQDNLLSCWSNFTSAKRNSALSGRSDYATHAAAGKGLGDCSILRSLSLGSYIWASMPRSASADQLDEGAALNECMEAESGEEEIRSSGGVGLKPTGSMMLLLTKYETTLKSLGLTEPIREPAGEEDTDFVFSRWGFHNGHPKGLDSDIAKAAKVEKSSVRSGTSSKTNLQKEGGRRSEKKISAKGLSDVFAAKCNCMPSMPSAWRRIKSWRKDKSYRRLKGSDRDEEEIIVASPQRSYTDGTSVVVCRTLSFTNSRTSTRGRHKHSSSWGGFGVINSSEEETASLLRDTENSTNKKVL
ncbi:hypothetical protein BSKO_00680 [Bryopsis sp. KO-2023]|nr:hypothetical protein BSKO_00680 [Bryopsis sp. KO-2023]